MQLKVSCKVMLFHGLVQLWAVKGTAIEFGLEAKVGDDTWIGFGFSSR